MTFVHFQVYMDLKDGSNRLIESTRTFLPSPELLYCLFTFPMFTRKIT